MYLRMIVKNTAQYKYHNKHNVSIDTAINNQKSVPWKHEKHTFVP